MNTKIIGLTGPAASGKSEVAKILKRRGARVIDADEIGHRLIEPQTDAWKDVVRTFGVRVLLPGGKINRKKLGAIVFSDRRMLKKLNRIMHPRMRQMIIEEVRGVRCEARGGRCPSTPLGTSEVGAKRREARDAGSEKKKIIVINAALLKEMGLVSLVDEVWVVLSGKAARLKRLLSKGMDREFALKLMRSQMSEADYRKMADRVIMNDKTKKVLIGAVLSAVDAKR